MTTFPLPAGAIPADLPQRLRLQLASSAPAPPDGEGWLHEVKHDGHRLVAIVANGTVRLLSRNARDRTTLFTEPFHALAAGLPALVLDGEIAVPDARGVTHLDALNDAIAERRPERFAYFAFDLLHLNGHDLRNCAIEDRKALLRDVVGAAGCERIIVVDHMTTNGAALFEAVRQVGAEGIVSKRAGSTYHANGRRDWVKTKVSETSRFVVTGFAELGPGLVDAIYVAELRGDHLVSAGGVQFGLAGKSLWRRLDRLRDGPARGQGRGPGIVPVRAELVVEVKYFGRIGGDYLRDGVVLAVHEAPAR
jgi:bifunctional non-homologous end joining protein LigD